MDLQKETEFFHDIAAQVLKLVADFNGKAEVTNYKELKGDYATEVDIAAENLIVEEIKKRFPGDSILAEERYSDTAIPDGRIWIIDPICGTTNVGRGLASFCTNIALADKKALIASIVVDHSKNEYFWTVGNQEVYINDRQSQPRETDEKFGTLIEIDMGALPKASEEQVKKHFNASTKMALIPGYILMTLNSSLGFAYTAIGKIDGFINITNNPWDICASAFLIQQSGGKITDINGGPWEITSVGAIGAVSADLHKKLLDIYTASQTLN